MAQLKLKNKVAAANWLGVNLMEMAKPEKHRRGENIKSFTIATAIAVMDSEESPHLSEFVRSDEMLELVQSNGSRSDDRKNFDTMITRAAAAFNKHAGMNWRLGRSGRRINHYMGLLRILKGRNEKERLQHFPLQPAAAIGMTTCSGVQWEPPYSASRQKQGVSPALANHIILMIRESTLHFRFREVEYYQMDREYAYRSVRLLELACSWENEVPGHNSGFLDLTKFHLFAPVLNPLMNLKFGEVRLKKLYKRARNPTPINILPASNLYPFDDFSGKESENPDSTSDSSDDEGNSRAISTKKKKRKRKMKKGLVKDKKAEENKKTEEGGKVEEEREALKAKMERERQAAAEKEQRDAAEKQKKELEDSRAAAAAASLAAENEVYKEARKVRERNPEEEAEQQRRRKDKRKRGEDANFLPLKEGRSPLIGLKEAGMKKAPSDAFPIDTINEAPEIWGYPRIREAQRKDKKVCQRPPGTCMAHFFSESARKVVPCKHLHPWVKN